MGPLPSVWVDDSVNQKSKKPTCTRVLGSVNISYEYRQETELLQVKELYIQRSNIFIQRSREKNNSVQREVNEIPLFKET